MVRYISFRWQYLSLTLIGYCSPGSVTHLGFDLLIGIVSTRIDFAYVNYQGREVGKEGAADAPAREVRAASHAGVSHGHERSESHPQLREATETQSNNPALMADCVGCFLVSWRHAASREMDEAARRFGSGDISHHTCRLRIFTRVSQAVRVSGVESLSGGSASLGTRGCLEDP
ncbi:hypothetical protein E2C01_032502 [Portunus trituberculatus]|uniref:Uncharacterized protein n=1 Tax=Portunus trituberculatus TaxID=210409 RepID=A0A5B7F1J7_PORTR|nr:hypothetical protein [Portunus trituberculatus]